MTLLLPQTITPLACLLFKLLPGVLATTTKQRIGSNLAKVTIKIVEGLLIGSEVIGLAQGNSSLLSLIQCCIRSIDGSG